MGLFAPKADMTFHAVGATWTGRFKMWVHYSVLHPWVLPALPDTYRMAVYRASRRWLYGPNANHEDLHAVLTGIRQVP